MALVPQVALWLRHALSEWMDGAPRPTATLARVARRLQLHNLTGWWRCHAQQGTQRRGPGRRHALPGSARLARWRGHEYRAGWDKEDKFNEPIVKL